MNWPGITHGYPPPGGYASAVNVHRCDEDNLGDQMASPLHYFDLGSDVQEIDIMETWPPADVYVVGGGGMLGQGWEDRLEELTRRERVIFWGTGSNIHHETEPSWPWYLELSELAGIRDYGSPYYYVPCPSCMHPAFDEARRVRPTQEVMIYEHFLKQVLISGPMRITNQQPFAAFEEVIRFVAQAETIISNSYHGCYWAMLLGRKVLCWRPSASRYFGFKYPLTMITGSNWRDTVVNHVTPDYLEECRALNRAFAKEVRRCM
jgi:hypothetical protein